MKKTGNKFIGIFDSGFGGLNILRSIVKKLPSYNYIYLGDTARAPYGTRSEETVYEFTRQAVDFFSKHQTGLVVFACNTASSEALRKVQKEYLPKQKTKLRVLGVLIPAAEEAVSETKKKKVGIIATEGTVRSGAFPREIHKLDRGIKVFQKACPLLVPLIEAGEENSKAAEMILENYLRAFEGKNIDTLILGCTHYGVLAPKIRQILGTKVRVISEAGVVARKLEDYLNRHREIDETLGRDGLIRFYSSDLTDKFQVLGSKFFGEKIRVKKTKIF